MTADVVVTGVHIDIQFGCQFGRFDLCASFDLCANSTATPRLENVHAILVVHQESEGSWKEIYNETVPYGTNDAVLNECELPEELDAVTPFYFSFQFRGPEDGSIKVYAEEAHSEVFIGKLLFLVSKWLMILTIIRTRPRRQTWRRIRSSAETAKVPALRATRSGSV